MSALRELAGLSVAAFLVACAGADPSARPTKTSSAFERAAIVVTEEMSRSTGRATNNACVIECAHEAELDDRRCDLCQAMATRLELGGFEPFANPHDWSGPPSGGFTVTLSPSSGDRCDGRVDRGVASLDFLFRFEVTPDGSTVIRSLAWETSPD